MALHHRKFNYVFSNVYIISVAGKSVVRPNVLSRLKQNNTKVTQKSTQIIR